VTKRRFRPGLFLLWLIASAIWIGICLWTLDFSCLQPSAGRECDQWTGPPLRLPYGASAVVVTFGVPIIALLVVAIVFIAIRAFRRNS